MTYEVLAALFAVAVCAGIVDGVAGGGGLLTLPALLMAGLPPAQALATNKIQALASVVSSARHFIRAGLVSLRCARWKILASLVGAGIGAFVVRLAEPGFLARLAPILLICVALFFLFSRNLTKQKGRARISEALFTGIAVVPIAFYDGFFGPGTGSIYVAAFVMLLGRGLPQATAETKVLNATGSAIAAVIFLSGSIVNWAAALAMVAGAVIGGRIGAGLAIKWGAPFIRAALVAVSIALATRLLVQHHDLFKIF